MFGVRACGCPPIHPIQSFRSSAMMKTTFGPPVRRDLARAGAGALAGAVAVVAGVGTGAAGLFFLGALNAVASPSIKATSTKAIRATG